MIAATLYSETWPTCYYDTPNIGSDEAPNSYYPHTIRNVKTFICPSTQNQIDINPSTPGAVTVDRNGVTRYRDLINSCHGDRQSTVYKNGHSYETFGYFERPAPINYTGVQKNPRTVNTVGASRVVLFLDADDPASIPGNAVNNCPDPPNNHREKGWNWGFVDGHSEWVIRRLTSHMITNGWMTSGASCPPAVQPY